MSARHFDDLVATAVQAGLISVQPGGPLGYAGEILYALDEDSEAAGS